MISSFQDDKRPIGGGLYLMRLALISGSHFLHIAFSLHHIYAIIHLHGGHKPWTHRFLITIVFTWRRNADAVRSLLCRNLLLGAVMSSFAWVSAKKKKKEQLSGQTQGLNIIELNYSASPKTHIHSNKSRSYSPAVTPMGVGRAS